MAFSQARSHRCKCQHSIDLSGSRLRGRRRGIGRTRASRVFQTAEDKWDHAIQLKVDLSDAIAIQNFSAAARLRDELESMKLSATQLVELDCVHVLQSGNQLKQRDSLTELAQLPACEGTQKAIARCLQDQALAVRDLASPLPALAPGKQSSVVNSGMKQHARLLKTEQAVQCYQPGLPSAIL
jgi:hypothetical protein